MKFLLMVLTVVIYCFGLLEAVPNQRMKRGLFGGPCPENEDCEQYVKGILKGICASYNIANGQYAVGTCGTVGCSEEQGVKKTPEDLSKPYPDCCSQCVPL